MGPKNPHLKMKILIDLGCISNLRKVFANPTI